MTMNREVFKEFYNAKQKLNLECSKIKDQLVKTPYYIWFLANYEEVQECTTYILNEIDPFLNARPYENAIYFNVVYETGNDSILVVGVHLQCSGKYLKLCIPVSQLEDSKFISDAGKKYEETYYQNKINELENKIFIIENIKHPNNDIVNLYKKYIESYKRELCQVKK